MSAMHAPPTILPLALERVGFAIGATRIIDDVSFDLAAGTRSVILGPNGAGKSVLMRLCHGLLTPSTGFWMTLASETAAAVALGGLGSLLMLLLPVGPLPGRTLYAVSPSMWAVVAVLSASLTGAVLASGPAFPLAALVLTAAAVAALLGAAVAVTRWVLPAWS